MPQTEFQIPVILRHLPTGMVHAEGIGFPEVSSLGDSVEDAKRRLAGRLTHFIRTPQLCPPLELHRRRCVASPAVAQLELPMTPPARAIEWGAAMVLQFEYVRWSERDDFHHAYVPHLGVGVFASQMEVLEKRLIEHIRRAISIRHRRLTLAIAESLQPRDTLELDQIQVTAQIQTPLERDKSEDSETKKESVLETLAQALPPTGTSGAKAIPEAEVYQVDEAVRRLADNLSGPRARSVLLVGPPGCGKTAIVRELARTRAGHGFGHTAFWTTSGSRLMQGQTGFGKLQERLLKLCRELSKTRGILHVGSLAELQEVGRTSRNAESIAGFLQPWLARGAFLLIAECTPTQLGAIQRANPQLAQAFLIQEIPASPPETTRRILQDLWRHAEGQADAEPEEAIDWLLRLHGRYATYSANPGRPIRFMRQLLAHRFPSRNFTKQDVTRAFALETGLPEVILEDAIPLDLTETRLWFSRRIIGQEPAIDRVLDVLALTKARLARPNRPLASLLLVGPTGTGKTELARSLATFLFGDPSRLVRFDLNEFSNPVSVQRLIGGFAGVQEGLLTSRVREQPFAVLLFDEFEKADASFFDLLLQILGEGRLTDAQGRVADFCNAVIVMTSNLGAESVQRGPSGFGLDGQESKAAVFQDAVRQFLRPEIFNRMDAVLPFAPLTRAMVGDIVRRHLSLIQLRDGIAQRSLRLDIADGVVEFLAEKGFDARYGARPLKRCIEQQFVAPLASALTFYRDNAPLKVSIKAGPRELAVQVTQIDGAQKPGESPRALNILTQSLTELRRKSTRLTHCAAARELENQISLLETLIKRSARQNGRRVAPPDGPQLHALADLRRCHTALLELEVEAARAESECLLAQYTEDPAGVDTSRIQSRHSALTSRFRGVQADLFRLQFTHPDGCVIAVYADPRNQLLRLALGYIRAIRRLGELGRVALFYASTTKRAGKPALLRCPVEHPATALPQEPRTWGESDSDLLTRALGKTRPDGELACVLLEANGPLFWPLFMNEAGFHEFKDEDPSVRYLVQVQNTDFEKFTPPDYTANPRGISNAQASRARVYSTKRESIEDRILGTVPWSGTGSIDRVLESLLQERLRRQMESVGEESDS